MLHFRIDEIVASICATGEVRVDDATAFLQRELLNVRQQAILVERPELRGTFFVPPAANQGNLGATHSTYQQEDFAGQAALGSSMSTNPPRVDVTREEATPLPYRHIEIAYGWSVKELRSAIMAGRSLDAAVAQNAQQVIAIAHDDIILIGDGTAPYKGLTGIFKLSGTLTYTLPVGGQSGTKLWADKSGKEIYADAMRLLAQTATNSNGVERPNMLALPLTLMTIASEKPWGVDNSESALDRITRVGQKLYPGLMIEHCEKLETAGAGGLTRMASYRRDNTKVWRDDLVLFEQAPPIVKGWQTEVHCHGETAGVRAAKPKSVCYADGG